MENTLTSTARVQIGPWAAVETITHKIAALFHSLPEMNVCPAIILALHFGLALLILFGLSVQD